MKAPVRILFAILLCLPVISLKATHLMGGEISWECQGDGRYIFTLKLYRDCSGVPLQLPVSLRVHNHPGLSSIPMSIESRKDISPQCNGSGPTIDCATAIPQGNPNFTIGAVEEFILRSQPVQLSGTPPSQGWIFTYDDCCRNGAISNLIISPGQTGMTLRAVMYPGAQAASPCFDSSPVFQQIPTVTICANNSFSYNPNAFDADNDSVTYSFGAPIDWLNGNAFTGTFPAAIPWQPAYSQASPLPGPQLGNSIPAELNSETGEITFTPRYTGNFVMVVKASSYRCGQLLAEIFREIQVIVIPCAENSPPSITAPFRDPASGLYTHFTDTVEAGQMVNFVISSEDNDRLPIGIPQTITVLASGGDFGTDFTDPDGGCPNKPCATLSPAPPAVLGTSGQITFNWQTSCEHVPVNYDCNDLDNTHTFVLLFQDDFCPTPNYRVATVSIVVTIPPPVPAPSFRCTEVLDNGDVKLSWIPPEDPRSIFHQYLIYFSSTANGPFQLIDSLAGINSSTYTHSGAQANSGRRYYYIRSASSCEGRVISPPSDTLQTMYLQVGGQGSGEVSINWNPISSPVPVTAILPYTLLKQQNQSGFQQFKTEIQENSDDWMRGCSTELYYYAEIADQSGCFSRSNKNGGIFSNDEAPAITELDSVSVDPFTNSILIGWQASSSTDVKAYVVYRLENGEVVETDTVQGRENTSLVITDLQPHTEQYSFAIAAIDSCNNLSEQSGIHATLLLRTDLSSCENRIGFSWPNYSGWSQAASFSQLFENENEGQFSLLNTIQGNANSSTRTNLTPESRYCYYLRVFSAGGASSTSAMICLDADVQDLPDFNYLRKATVSGKDSVYTECYFDAYSDAYAYRISRREYPEGTFRVINSGPLPQGDSYIRYTDIQVRTGEKSYEYRFELIDKCENISSQSNIGRSILLKGQAVPGYKNRLQWNTYEDWDAGVENYLLLRKSGRGEFEQILSLSDSSFTDEVLTALDSTVQFCYQVIAVENQGNQYGFRDSSYSNVVCLQQEVFLWIPNAFRPGSLEGNSTFKGIGLYENICENHEFRIFNRWGEQLFYTADPAEAWDGTYQNNIVTSGVYVYSLRFKLPGEKMMEYRGAVLALD